jgi:hypothetical protein
MRSHITDIPALHKTTGACGYTHLPMIGPFYMGLEFYGIHGGVGERFALSMRNSHD